MSNVSVALWVALAGLVVNLVPFWILSRTEGDHLNFPAATLHLMGHLCVGSMWAQMANASYEALENGTSDEEFHQTKLATGRDYMARQLPATSIHLARIESGADTVMELEAANF